MLVIKEATGKGGKGGSIKIGDELQGVAIYGSKIVLKSERGFLVCSKSLVESVEGKKDVYRVIKTHSKTVNAMTEQITLNGNVIFKSAVNDEIAQSLIESKIAVTKKEKQA